MSVNYEDVIIMVKLLIFLMGIALGIMIGLQITGQAQIFCISGGMIP